MPDEGDVMYIGEKMRLLLTVLMFSLSAVAFSDTWTSELGSKVEIVNPGVQSTGATLFSFVDTAFVGCTKTTGAFLIKDNSNYSEIFSVLLAAKMADKLVRVYYRTDSGCNYPEIVQVYML